MLTILASVLQKRRRRDIIALKQGPSACESRLPTDHYCDENVTTFAVIETQFSGEQEECHLPRQPLSAIFRHLLNRPPARVQANAGCLPPGGCPCHVPSRPLWVRAESEPSVPRNMIETPNRMGKCFHSPYSTHLQIIRILVKNGL